MKVYIEKQDKHSNIMRVPKGFTASLLLKKLKINPQTVIIVRNDEVILLDEAISAKDDIKILSVISGG